MTCVVILCVDMFLFVFCHTHACNTVSFSESDHNKLSCEAQLISVAFISTAFTIKLSQVRDAPQALHSCMLPWLLTLFEGCRGCKQTRTRRMFTNVDTVHGPQPTKVKPDFSR